MLTDEERDFIKFYGFQLIDETWNLDDGFRRMDGQRNIASTYTIKMRGEQGIRMLMERLAAAENRRMVRTEIIRARVIE